MEHSRRKRWLMWIMVLAAVPALGAAAYAWFTSNRAVSTDTVTGRTGTENLKLQVSSSPGSGFRDQEEAAIRQVNQTDFEQLMPVSTSDLTNFVYSPVTMNGMASVFEPVENEQYYYHGRIYLRAVGDALENGSRMNLYLDQSDGALAGNLDGRLLNAARLGLMFDGDASSAVIFRLSEESNPGSIRNQNTVVNGRQLGDGQVLSYRNGTVTAVTDPSVTADEYTISLAADQPGLPQRPLLVMEANRIYTLDIYFYLEGCDPDCTDGISGDAAQLHLAFYGVLGGGGSG